jgi:hypothetical protein
MAMNNHHLAGAIHRGRADEIERVFAGPEWTVRRHDNEMIVSSDAVYLDIYIDDHDAGSRYNYLITGYVNGSLEEAAATLTQVGAMLERGGVLYHFELHDDDTPDGVRVIEHPDC